MSEPLKVFKSPVRLDYVVHAGHAPSRFLRGIAEGKILGQRCPACAKVYVPPRGSCPTCGVPTDEEVAVSDRGTITMFCVVRVPYEGMAIALPFVTAWILLDGADIAMLHLIQGVPVEEVRMGMRVRAEWVAKEELAPTLESIRYFAPSGEPDAPYESYARHA